MWRARVLRKNYEGRVVVAIPKLFGSDPVGPMQAAVDVDVNDEVIVADLNPDAKVRDWWVVGYASQIGRWGTPYPHDHPMGQVIGLVDALAGKADAGATGGSVSWASVTGKPTTFPPDAHSHTWDSVTGKPTTFPPAGHTHAQADVTGLPALASDIGAATHLATPGTIPRRFDNGGFRVVTGTNAQDAVNVEHVSTNYVAKSDIGGWVNCTLSAYLAADSTAYPTLAVRNTPLGMQIRGRYRTVSAVPLDAVLFTLPAGFTPTFPTISIVAAMGPGPAYDSLSWGMEFQVNRTVTARQNYVANARISLSAIITL